MNISKLPSLKSMGKGLEVMNVNANGMACIHFQSDLNDWMECLVYVPDSFEEAALNAVRKGVEVYREEDGQQPYGDCIENELIGAGIPYLIEYSEYDEETDEPYLSWTAHTDEVDGCKALNTKYVEF